MMVRREVAEQMGWDMNTKVPIMYFEDIEYCYRVWQAGFSVHYLSEATIKHWGGQSTKRSINRVKQVVGDQPGQHYLIIRRHRMTRGLEEANASNTG